MLQMWESRRVREVANSMSKFMAVANGWLAVDIYFIGNKSAAEGGPKVQLQGPLL